MVTKETASLTQMLLEAKIPTLPQENDESKVWTLAIVKILRNTGVSDYVIAQHDYFSWNEINVKSEMANVGIPKQVLGIYPYDYLNSSDVPDVKDKQDIVTFLARVTHEDEEYLSGLTNEALKGMFYNTCIKHKVSKWGQKRTEEDYTLGIKEPEVPVKVTTSILDETQEEVIPKKEPEEVPEVEEKVEENPVLGEEPKKRGRKPKE